MTASELVVVMGDRVAGTITRRNGSLSLAYNEDYLARGGTPLSVTMPLSDERYGNATVAPWLDGLLPDSDEVRRAWGREFSVSARSPFGLLSTPVGEECAGAAKFVTPDRLEKMLAGAGDVRWLTEAEVAQRLRDLRSDASAWLGTDFTGRFSLAGAQAKTALLHDPENGRWGVPSGAAATSHILKPAITGLDQHDLNEHLCLRSASLCGLLSALTRIEEFEDTSVVVATRYDRTVGDPWLTRIHQEDLCQALGVPPESKYQNEGGPSTTEIARLLRTVLPAGGAYGAVRGVWRLFDAVTFNWLIAGTDAHAKNYSLLLSGQQVAFAPLYDIASALPYPAMPLRKLNLAMKYGHDYSLLARGDQLWAKVASEFSLPEDEVRFQAKNLMDMVPDAFSDVANEEAVTSLGSDLPKRMVDLVRVRVEQCRKALG